MLLTLGIGLDIVMHQLDVKAACPHGHLQEIVYVDPPQRCPRSDGSKVCLLSKVLYGIRQSEQIW